MTGGGEWVSREVWGRESCGREGGLYSSGSVEVGAEHCSSAPVGVKTVRGEKLGAFPKK